MPKGKIIFVVGGVMSGIGKGIIVSSIANILIDCGLTVNTIKLDPYLNVDAGTINPFEHGETYVTHDGLEADLDLGHYERFTGRKTCKNSIITSGKIYQNIIQKERRGEYLGSTVQMIPHVSNEIINFIKLDVEKYDITICEIGGTVGDIESMVHMEAIRQIRGEIGAQDSLLIFLTYIPYLQVTEEFKTKPAQDSIKTLLHCGLQPNMLICRHEFDGGAEQASFTKKLALYSNVSASNIFVAPNVDNIYKLPYMYSQQNMHGKILDSLDISGYCRELCGVNKIYHMLENINGTVGIHLVVKYGYTDAYLSLCEALKHAAYSIGKNVKINWIDVRNMDAGSMQDILQQNRYGILVPGGFGSSGVENKIEAIHYARVRNIPFLGICYGMQLMGIEYARNVVGLTDATSEELDEEGRSSCKVVHIINREEVDKGGTMRLGDYRGIVKKGTLAEKIYGEGGFEERHRHRYEINTEYVEILEKHGLLFSGVSCDGIYMEIAEVAGLDFFMGVQFHPEFNTCIFNPNKVILEFIKKSAEYQEA